MLIKFYLDTNVNKIYRYLRYACSNSNQKEFAGEQLFKERKFFKETLASF